MAEIVVSFAEADKARARTVTAGLSLLGYNVVETRLDEPAPRTMPQIVLWSRASAAPPRLKRGDKRVIVARLDAREPPLIRGAQSVNLQSWRGRPDHRGWRTLVTALAAPSAATAAAVVSPPMTAAAFSAPAAGPEVGSPSGGDDRAKGWLIAAALLKVAALAGLAAGVYFALQPG